MQLAAYAVTDELAHDGVTGYGEAAMPPHLGESQASVAAFLTRATPLLTALRDPFQLEEILPALDALAPGNTAAKAAVDLALHDWIGKKLGAPWHRLWGLDAAKAPVTSFTIGIDTPDVVRQKTREASIYKIIKVKLGRDDATDRAIITAIREITDVPLTIDANQGWKNRDDALRLIVNAHIGTDAGTAYDAACAELQRMQAALAQPCPLASATLGDTGPVQVPAGNFTKAAFEKMVDDSKEFIRAGDIFQIVLSQRFSRD